MKFSMIVATDLSMGIGIKGSLPWHFQEDMRFFKEVTTQKIVDDVENVVIMGRKTWESLPNKFKPLPQRKNIVISSNKDYQLPLGVVGAVSVEDALEKAEQYKGKVFIIGGASVYAQAIKNKDCHEVFLTKIHQNFSCDTFFPTIPSDFQLKDCKSCISEGNVLLEFLFYTKGIS